MARYLRAQKRFLEQHSAGLDAFKQRILEVKQQRSRTIITTCGMTPGRRRRYHVVSWNGEWKISRFEVECHRCQATGKERLIFPCSYCEGTGWNVI